MNILPIKTNDVVDYQGEPYLVRSIRMTDQGFILDMNPIKSSSVTVHSSEVTIQDVAERTRRAKSIGLNNMSAKSIEVPSGLTTEEANKVLEQYMKMKANGR